MRRSSTPEGGGHPRRRLISVLSNPAPPDLQSLSASAPLYEQARRKAAEAEIARNTEHLSAVIAIQNRIAELDLAPDQVLDLVVQRAMVITNSSGAAIALAQAGIVVCRACAGSMAPALGATLDPESRFSGECLRSGEVLCCEDSETDSRVNLAACRQLGIRSILAVPVRLEQHIIGVLEVFSPRVGAFGGGEAQTLQLLAGLVSEALRTAHVRAAESTRPPSPPSSAENVVAQPPTLSALASATTPPPKPAVVGTAHLHTLENYAQHRAVVSRRALLVIGVAIGSVFSIWYWRAPAPARVPQGPTAVRPAPPMPLPPPLPLADDGSPKELNDIKFHSKPEFTSIALYISGPVNYESGRLTNPDRIYFDLKNTHLAPRLLSSSQTTDVGDAFVFRIRVAQKESNTTRIVLNLNCHCDYSSVVSSSPPYRLMIVVQRPPGSLGQVSPATARPQTSKHETAHPLQVAADEPKSSSSALQFKIVIDPGHGGADRGTVGPSGLQEKDLVLDVAQRLGKLVSDRLSAQVIYTRTDDRFVALQERSALANSTYADLFVSIHANSSDHRSVRGVETFYMDPRLANRVQLLWDNDGATREPHAVSDKIVASRQLAATVQHALYTKLAAADPRLRNRGVKTAPLVVLIGPNMPSILSEISFVSSPTEERNLKNPEYRNRIAEALYRGIKIYRTRTATRKGYAINRALGKNDEEYLRSD